MKQSMIRYVEWGAETGVTALVVFGKTKNKKQNKKKTPTTTTTANKQTNKQTKKKLEYLLHFKFYLATVWYTMFIFHLMPETRLGFENKSLSK